MYGRPSVGKRLFGDAYIASSVPSSFCAIPARLRR
jgi:hypothetical protein